jgi:hypothetical protein
MLIAQAALQANRLCKPANTAWQRTEQRLSVDVQG